MKKTDFTHHYMSPLGPMTMAGDGDALIGLWFDGQKYFGSTLSDERAEDSSLPVFDETEKWLYLYFSGNDPGPAPALAPRGSAFRRSVWDILLTIPYGHTITYGEIAAKLESADPSKKVSAQAVGGAVGHNPISIIIPCHRVIGADGNLTGYAGGIDRKSALLDLERASLK